VVAGVWAGLEELRIVAKPVENNSGMYRGKGIALAISYCYSPGFSVAIIPQHNNYNIAVATAFSLLNLVLVLMLQGARCRLS